MNIMLLIWSINVINVMQVPFGKEGKKSLTNEACIVLPR